MSGIFNTWKITISSSTWAYRNAFQDRAVARDLLVDINAVRIFLNDFNALNDIEQRAIAGIAYALLNLARGHLIFPYLEPFGTKQVGASELHDDSRALAIYSATNTTVRSEASRFFMRIQYQNEKTGSP